MISHTMVALRMSAMLQDASAEGPSSVLSACIHPLPYIGERDAAGRVRRGPSRRHRHPRADPRLRGVISPHDLPMSSP